MLNYDVSPSPVTIGGYTPMRVRRRHPFLRIAVVLISIVLLQQMAVSTSWSKGLKERARKWTADVAEILGPAADEPLIILAEFPPPLPAGVAALWTLAGMSTAMACTVVGELIDYGIACWWDPQVKVFPNDPDHIVTIITDAQIVSVADDVLADLFGTRDVSYADLQALNTVSPGMGNAACTLFIASIRTFAHTAQGAAAYAEDGLGSPSVNQACALLADDLEQYVTSIRRFAPFIDQLESNPAFLDPNFAPFTSDAYLAFLGEVQSQGAMALPRGEVAVGERCLALANVHMEGTNLSDGIVAYLSRGDTGNEAADFPPSGYTQRALLESGIGTFGSGSIFECDICLGSPIPTLTEWGMIIMFVVLAGGIVWFVVRQRKRVATA